MIFVGYQGIGKSTLAGKNNYIDLESGNFWVTDSDGITYRPSEWIAIYVNMAQHLSNQGYNVMMSSHKALRDELNRRNIKYYTVYPSHELKDVWIAKLQERKRLAYLKARQWGCSNMVRLTKVKDKYLSEVKLNWAQKELLQKLQDAAEHHKRLVLLKGRRVN